MYLSKVNFCEMYPTCMSSTFMLDTLPYPVIYPISSDSSVDGLFDVYLNLVLHQLGSFELNSQHMVIVDITQSGKLQTEASR